MSDVLSQFHGFLRTHYAANHTSRAICLITASHFCAKSPYYACSKKVDGWLTGGTISRRDFLRLPYYLKDCMGDGQPVDQPFLTQLQQSLFPALPTTENLFAPVYGAKGVTTMQDMVFYLAQSRTMTTDDTYQLLKFCEQTWVEVKYTNPPQLPIAELPQRLQSLGAWFSMQSRRTSIMEALRRFITSYCDALVFFEPRNKATQHTGLRLMSYLIDHNITADSLKQTCHNHCFSTVDIERHIAALSSWIPNSQKKATAIPSRREAFQFCYHCNFSVSQGAELFQALHMSWVYCKNYEEIIWDMGLRFGLTAFEAEALILEYRAIIAKKEPDPNAYTTLRLQNAYVDKMNALYADLQAANQLDNKEAVLQTIHDYLDKNLCDYTLFHRAQAQLWEQAYNPHCNVGLNHVLKDGRIRMSYMAELFADMTPASNFRGSEHDEVDYLRSCNSRLRSYQRKWAQNQLVLEREDCMRLLLITGVSTVEEMNNRLEMCSFYPLSKEPFDNVVIQYLSKKRHDLKKEFYECLHNTQLCEVET